MDSESAITIANEGAEPEKNGPTTRIVVGGRPRAVPVASDSQDSGWEGDGRGRTGQSGDPPLAFS